MQRDFSKTIILEAVVGSKLYGTATPDSDTDIRGVFIPPIKTLIDPFIKTEILNISDEEDTTLYSLGKFINLCADNNPNILELLFVPDRFINFKDNMWDRVVENRHLFLSKNIKNKFLGYAFSQLEKLKRHREWFIDPPDHEPTRSEYGLENVPSTSMVWLNSLKHSMNFDILKDDVVDEIRNEYKYRQAHKKWEQYVQWRTNRNPKRKASEEKSGYDGKFASHVFRLMTEGEELLLYGNIKFPLSNADWLLAVKNGLYTYEEVLHKAESLSEKFDHLYDVSVLPNKPDRDALKELYYKLVLG